MKLAGGAVFICGARHRDRARVLRQTVVGFILNRQFRNTILLPHLLVKTTAPESPKPGNNAVRGVVLL